MPLTDLPLADCRAFRPDLPVPADFDEFWARTLDDSPTSRQESLDKPEFTRVDTGLPLIRTYDVTVPGFAGRPVRGWLHLPTGDARPLGCVVEFLGYGRGRGLPHEKLLWSSAGYAHLVMDTRGQGWSAAGGATADTDAGGAGTVPGFVTRGIESPRTHYYRRVFVDAVRCVEAVRGHPEVDPGRVVVTGVSQGGGIALAVSGLVPGLAGVMPDVPFLCNFRRAAEISGRPPYTEIADYLKLHRDRTEAVFTTLSYFDAALLAERATAPALFSIAMMDEVCPPSTCFTAYNRYAGPKDVRVYAFNGHEGGAEYQQREQLVWVRALLG
ncbi:acetylxylan esterase [Streptomyces sp. AM 4-1-1]|uniref:acetylxylan esterase n=1 Tax=Streptomyces sp. AM 4-1-1 TaxID=3028710 RepID=UPI0023B899AA|nr:acetylxylan esterase [Streptomyces sp. AM 4-1-1]WEH36518.1 acetylxylan esterase [Streptomyces sp. AM 4-1-1]